MSTAADSPALRALGAGTLQPVQEPALQALVEQVRVAAAERRPLRIEGGGTKAFYGEATDPQAELLDTRSLRGISSYEPSELVVTVRAGTPLADLEATLAQQGQCLPFEPPRFAPGGTVGGMVAAGLAGPSRAYVGGVRDYVLGTTLLNGRAEVLSFGGQVMKNVAGYDVSRLMVGSLGILGVLCEVSLKVLPVAPAVATLRFELDEAEAIQRINAWSSQPLPIHASAWWNGTLVVRLAGAAAAVQAARTRLGGEEIEAQMAAGFWAGLRDQRDEFFAAAAHAMQAQPGKAVLWRVSVPGTALPMGLADDTLIEWGGAQRWFVSPKPASAIRAQAQTFGGHATAFRGLECGVFTPLVDPLARIHQQLKMAFDPMGILNPGRLYPDL